MVENTASDGFVCVKYNAALHYTVSKSSSNFAREEYRQRLRLEQPGASPAPPYGGLLVQKSLHLLKCCLFMYLEEPKFELKMAKCVAYVDIPILYNDTGWNFKKC